MKITKAPHFFLNDTVYFYHSNLKFWKQRLCLQKVLLGQAIKDLDEVFPPSDAIESDVTQEFGGVDAKEVDPLLLRKFDCGCGDLCWNKMMRYCAFLQHSKNDHKV